MTIKLYRCTGLSVAKAYSLLGLAMGLPITVWAAPLTQPDIGAIIQPVPGSNLTISETQRAVIRPEQLQQKPLAKADAGLQQGEITVQQIKFQHDLQQVSDAELQQFVQPYLNKTYRLSEFKTIVSALQQWLMTEHGLIKAQVWIPLQEIEQGVVQLDITQGTVAGYVVSDAVQNQHQISLLKQLAEQSLEIGSPLTQKSLEEVAYRSIDHVNQPVQIVLMPTATVGQYNVLLDVHAKAKISGNITLDNTGNRYTSQFRDYTTVRVNDLTGHFDQLTLGAQVLNKYQHSLYGRYEIPFAQGWRLGVDAQYSDYELCCEFKSLDAKGDVKQFSADALYTLKRQRDLSVWLGAKAKYWNGQNEQLGNETSDREIKSLSLLGNLAWSDFADHYLQLELSGGDVDFNNAADRASDKISAEIEGGYVKALANYFINYPLNAHSTAFSHVTAQLASKNLESSEKLSMGGLSAIRAYPYGESMGDLGAVAQLEYRYQVLPNLQGAAFYDIGYVRRNQDKWVKGTVNQYHLHGLGASVTWQPIPQARLQLITAAKLGNNAGRDVNGNDSDGKDSSVRAWVVGSWSF